MNRKQPTHPHTRTHTRMHMSGPACSHSSPAPSLWHNANSPGSRDTTEVSAEKKESLRVNLTGSWSGRREGVCAALVPPEPCSVCSISQDAVPSDMAEPDMVRESVVAELLLGESILSGSKPPNISLFSLTRAACSRTPSSCESMSAKWKSVDWWQISANSIEQRKQKGQWFSGQRCEVSDGKRLKVTGGE